MRLARKRENQKLIASILRPLKRHSPHRIRLSSWMGTAPKVCILVGLYTQLEVSYDGNSSISLGWPPSRPRQAKAQAQDGRGRIHSRAVDVVQSAAIPTSSFYLGHQFKNRKCLQKCRC